MYQSLNKSIYVIYRLGGPYCKIISPRSKKWPEAFTIKTVNNVFIFYCQMIQDQEDAIRVIFKSPKFISLTVKSTNNSLPRRL